MHCQPKRCTHPCPPVPPFLLVQNLYSKWIAPTYNIRPNFDDDYSRYRRSFKALLKNNYDLQRRLVWSAKNYFRPLGAPCLERRLWIRVQLAPFSMNSWSLYGYTDNGWTGVRYTRLSQIQACLESREQWKAQQVEKLVVSKVAWVRRKISLNRKRPSKNIYDAKGRPLQSEKNQFTVVRVLSLERRLN